MKLLLIRHPAPEIPKGTCYGRLDVPLRSDTQPDILAISERIRAREIGTVWSSPSVRCLIPAQAAAAAAQARLKVDSRLQELNFGQWEGMRWDDVPRSALDCWAADPSGFAPPGGETGLELVTRVNDLFKTLLAEAVDCAVVSHGGPLKILCALAAGETLDLLATPPQFGAILTFSVCPGTNDRPALNVPALTVTQRQS